MTMHIDLAALGLTPETEASIMTAADAAGEAATEAKAGAGGPKGKLLAEALAAAASGAVPPAPTFPVSNYWSQRKADALHELTKAGDLEGLKAYAIGGSNTYSRALRKYQAICIAYLETAPKLPVKKKGKAPKKENP